MTAEECSRLWPCHFCGVLMPETDKEFYRLLPAGFADCGECTKDWGFAFRNQRRKVGRRLFRRQEGPAEQPPMFFSEEEIPLEHSQIAYALGGVIAKANEWHKGNAIGDLLMGIAIGGLGVLRECEWGKASWLPPIAPADPADPWVKDLDEQWRHVANVNRAMLALDGLFAGFTVLALVSQRGKEAADGKPTVGSAFIEHSFGGDCDQFAAVILPNFYNSGQALYWAFRREPEEVLTRGLGSLLFENLALVFQHPDFRNARTGDIEERTALGPSLDLGKDWLTGAFTLHTLFSREFGFVCHYVSQRSAEAAKKHHHQAGR